MWSKNQKPDFCEHCVHKKRSRVKYSTAVHKIKGILNYIHSNLWGHVPIQSKGGSLYLLIFIDNFLKRVWIYFLKYKNEVFPIFKK